MKFSIVIPTNANMPALEAMADSLLVNTAQKQKVRLFLVDNKNTFNTDLRPFAATLRAAWEARGGDPDDIVLLKTPERVGLTKAWNFGFMHAYETDWVLYVNDDCLFRHCWDDQLRKLIRTKQEFDCFLLCHPYNWSGWAANHRFIATFPFRTEFPSGYFEDDDLYLRVARRYRLHTKAEVYTKAIYCLPFNEQDKHNNPRALMTHAPKPTKVRWNNPANRVVFEKYWREVPKGTPGAIQNKNVHHWYIPTELEKARG